MTQEAYLSTEEKIAHIMTIIPLQTLTEGEDIFTTLKHAEIKLV